MFVKVTGSVFIKYNYCTSICNDIHQQSTLTYIQQAIPLPYSLIPHFEKLFGDDGCSISSNNIHKIITICTSPQVDDSSLGIFPTQECEKVDFSGRRVRAYIYLVLKVQVLD